MKIRWLMLGCVLAGQAFGGDLYKCTDADGKVTFSQARCAADAQPVSLDVVRPTDAQVRDRQRWTREYQQAREERLARKRAALAAEERQKAIDAVAANYAAEQASIAERRARANNNAAGAALEGALATDAAASDARYQAAMEQLTGRSP